MEPETWQQYECACVTLAIAVAAAHPAVVPWTHSNYSAKQAQPEVAIHLDPSVEGISLLSSVLSRQLLPHLLCNIQSTPDPHPGMPRDYLTMVALLRILHDLTLYTPNSSSSSKRCRLG